MTRLQTGDIEEIARSLKNYDRTLKEITGFNLLGIAARACGHEDHSHKQLLEAVKSFRICVVPITAGLGIISTFAETVCAILNHMGFAASVTAGTDTSGIAQAFEGNADAVMMSDDHRFVGLNLHNRKVADNSEATGRAFATALDLMAGGLKGKEALVMGCGPVGTAAASTLLHAGARVALYDIQKDIAEKLKQKLNTGDEQSRRPEPPHPSAIVETNLDDALKRHRHILEATPMPDTITRDFIFPDTLVATPGVPLGLTKEAIQLISEDHLIHDKLELGVAVMALSLLTS